MQFIAGIVLLSTLVVKATGAEAIVAETDGALGHDLKISFHVFCQA